MVDTSGKLSIKKIACQNNFYAHYDEVGSNRTLLLNIKITYVIK